MQTQLSEIKTELYHMHISNNVNIYSSSSHSLSIRISRPLRLHMNHLCDVVASNIFLVLLCCVMLDCVWKKNITVWMLQNWEEWKSEDGNNKELEDRLISSRKDNKDRCRGGTRCGKKVMSLKINEHPGPAGLVTLMHWIQGFKVAANISNAIRQTSSVVDGS